MRLSCYCKNIVSYYTGCFHEILKNIFSLFIKIFCLINIDYFIIKESDETIVKKFGINLFAFCLNSFGNFESTCFLIEFERYNLIWTGNEVQNSGTIYGEQSCDGCIFMIRTRILLDYFLMD